MEYKSRLALMTLVALTGVLFLATGVGTVAAQSAPDCSTVTYNGGGTTGNPYEVADIDQLQCIKEKDLDANYVQVSDIDASGTSSWNGGSGFNPIGDFDSVGAQFNGTFDGQGFNITGLTIDRTGNSDVGLFGFVLSGGEITNVSVLNADITGSQGVGGLVAANSGTVAKSYVSGSVKGPNSATVGGLIGGVGSNGVVSASYSTASVVGSSGVGGLTGVNDGIVSNSYATGSVDGEIGVGSLAGTNSNGATIENSYGAGSVTGNLLVGGLVGENNGAVVESYWDTQTTGQTASSGGTGLTTSEMTGSAATSNMQGFDFTTTWETVTNPDDYPVLVWQSQRGIGGGGGGGGGNSPPTASFLFNPSNPDVGETVNFDAADSIDADGNIQSYEWDFDGDGTTDATTQSLTYTYTYGSSGTYTVELTVTDDGGATDTTTNTVTVSQTGGGGSIDDYRDDPNDPTSGVSLSGLQNAINDFISKNISLSLLQDVINAFILS